MCGASADLKYAIAKRLLSLVLTLAMVFALIPVLSPTSAQAAQITTALDITSMSADNSGDGWTWNNANSILTLNGLDLCAADETALTVSDGTTINVTGNSMFGSTYNGSAASYGIYCDGDLTIEVNGGITLSVTCGDGDAYNSIVIYTDSGFEKTGGGTIEVNGGPCGVLSNGGFTMNGGTIYAKGDTNAMSVSGSVPDTVNVTIAGKDAGGNYAVPAVFAGGVIKEADGSAAVLDVKIAYGDTLYYDDVSGKLYTDDRFTNEVTGLSGWNGSGSTLTLSGLNFKTVTATALDVPSGSPASADTNIDGKLESLPTPTRTGYTFNGWFTASSGGTEVTINTVFSANTTIYACWTSNGGGSSGSSGTTTSDMSAAVQAAVEAALADGAELVLPPMEFKITATYNEQTVEVGTFSRYVARSMEITAEQAAKITTAVVVAPDGTTRQVPTRVYQQNGKWYEAAVNEMGSRMIISGIGNNLFAGERDITRAEFAAIIIRALGVPSTGNSAVFTDVSRSAWILRSRMRGV